MRCEVMTVVMVMAMMMRVMMMAWRRSNHHAAVEVVLSCVCECKGGGDCCGMLELRVGCGEALREATVLVASLLRMVEA